LESRNCPETVPGGVPGLWELITPDYKVWSWRGLNQTCSPRRDLSNDVSHSQFGGREEVDSRLLVVGNQTASLTPGPSFAHNLSFRCPNGQCESIFDIYASRPFQWHQEHNNARCFGPCCRTLNIRESRRTPNLHFFQVLGFTPTLGQSRVATSLHHPSCGTTHVFYNTQTNRIAYPCIPHDSNSCCKNVKRWWLMKTIKQNKFIVFTLVGWPIVWSDHLKTQNISIMAHLNIFQEDNLDKTYGTKWSVIENMLGKHWE
jgi:hypothetical protein